MGEVMVCQECGNVVPIGPKRPYVVMNRPTAKSKDQWVYAHVKCGKAMAKRAKSPPEAIDPYPLLQKMVEAMSPESLGTLMSHFDADSLRRLGLQRITDQ